MIFMSQQPHVAADRAAIDAKIVTEHRCRSGAHGEQPTAGAQKAGLAGSVRALQQDNLARPDGQIESRQRRKPAKERHGGLKLDDGCHAGQMLRRSFDPLPPECDRLRGIERCSPMRRVHRYPSKVVNWSRIIGNVGRTLITSGMLILLFVVYQLWGTALHERRAQGELRNEFATLMESAAPSEQPLLELDNSELPVRLDPKAILSAATDADADTEVADVGRAGRSGPVLVDPTALIIDPATSVFGPPPPPPEGGDAVAQIRIPAIGVDKVVVEGVGTNALKKGPGHYSGTPLPGQSGNAAIAAHRTTYGAPFYDLDALEENDLIYVTTTQGAFQYRVFDSFVVQPSEVWVLNNTADDRLTLTTCHPRLSARERLVVLAELIGPAAPADTNALAGGAVAQLPGEVVSDDGLADEDETGQIPVSTEVTTTQGTALEGTASENSDVDSADAVPVSSTRAAVSGEQLSNIDGDRAAAWPAIFWAAVAAFVWALTWYFGKVWRRWPSYLAGGGLFLLVLFVFFENFSRLLPPGV